MVLKKVLRKVLLITLRLPEERIYLPILENCIYEEELRHKCEECLNSIDVPYCNYQVLPDK